MSARYRRDNPWSPDSQTIKARVQKPSGIPIHSHMRGDRLDNASWSSRALRTAGRLDIKILWRIPPTRGRTQAPKSMRRANTFQRRRKRFSVTATENSADSVRTLYHNVSVPRWRDSVSFDVRICLLLIKAYSREKLEREREKRGCIESVVSQKQNARLILERRRHRYILRKMLARISMPLCRRYSYQLSLQLYLSQRSSKHRIKHFERR